MISRPKCYIPLILLVVMMISCGSKNKANEGKEQSKCETLDSSSEKNKSKSIVSAKTYDFSDACCNLKMKYPQFSGSKYVFLNREIVKTINDLRDEARSADLCKEMKQLNPDFKAEANADYKIWREDSKLLSLYMETYIYLGGAHGMPSRDAYNIDLKTGKKISLDDFFVAAYDYKKPINAFIKKKIAEHSEEFFPEDFKGINSETGFYVDDSHLHIFFPPYEIAPYSSGFPTFDIPLSDFENKLRYR